MDKIDPESKDEGNSKVEAPANEAGNAGEEKKEDLSLEEMTYKERYGNSTKENQRIMAQLTLAKKKLGLSEDEELTEEQEEEAKKEGQDEEKESSEKSDIDDEEEKDADEEEKDNVKAEKNDSQSPYDYRVIAEKGEETAIDIIWDNFIEKHPDVESSAKLRENLISEAKRFRIDAIGNTVPLKQAFEDAYFWVNRDNVIKKTREDARDEGIIEATKNKDGEIRQTSSKSISVKNTKQLTDREREVARKQGLTDEEYSANKVVYDDDDE